MPPRRPERDPRYRPFRVAVFSLYLVIVGGFSLLVINSVVRSAAKMTPPSPRSTGSPLAVSDCVARAQTLWQELEGERERFSEAKDATQLQDSWQRFRMGWMGKLRATQARCGYGSPDRRALTRAFRALEEVENLYTTSAMQYGGEIAPTVDAFRRALAASK